MNYFEKGKECYDQGKYGQALEYFMAAIEQDKLNVEACYWCAMTYKAMNNDFGYRKSIFKALSIEPDSAEALAEVRLFIGGASAAVSIEEKTNSNSIRFSVSPTRRVLFAPGNVVYDGITQKWKFAEKQYAIIGKHYWIHCMGTCALDGKDESYDLFYWGTSNDLSQGAEKEVQFFSEWGDHFSGGWRTLSWNEWDYLFSKRTGAKKLFGFSSVLGVDGVVILPDDWRRNGVEEMYDDVSSWNEMESYGAVFLPVAGYFSERDGRYYLDETDWVYQTCSNKNFYYRLDKRQFVQRQVSKGHNTTSGLFSIIQQAQPETIAIPHMNLDKKYQLPVRLVKDVVE